MIQTNHWETCRTESLEPMMLLLERGLEPLWVWVWIWLLEFSNLSRKRFSRKSCIETQGESLKKERYCLLKRPWLFWFGIGVIVAWVGFSKQNRQNAYEYLTIGLIKGGVILNGIFNLDPSSQNWTKILFIDFFSFRWKVQVQCFDLVCWGQEQIENTFWDYPYL